MSFTSGIQLSVELTRLTGAFSSTASQLSDMVKFARDLRKSGSDIVVEEDLANIFGRGDISQRLMDDFKSAVSKEITITPLHPTSEVVLKPGPSATVTRAMLEHDRRYLAIVI
jgi:hypothetical protein